MLKKLFATVLALMIVGTMVAQRWGGSSNGGHQNNGGWNRGNGNSLVFNSSTSLRQYVLIFQNGTTYSLANNQSVIINNIPNGNYNVQIIRIKPQAFGQPRNEILYNGVISLKGGFETSININLLDDVNITDRQVIFANTGNGGGCNNGNRGGNTGGWNNGNNIPCCGQGNQWGRRRGHHRHCG
jgi:hypothetical protein